MKKPPPLRELIIDRKTWLRGSKESYLLRPKDGKKCCLGFLAEQCGIPTEFLHGKDSPVNLVVPGKRLPHGMGFLLKRYEPGKSTDSEACRALMYVNDYQGSTLQQREQKLTEMFANHGITVRFIN